MSVQSCIGDYKELLNQLHEAESNYCLIGGHAVEAWFKYFFPKERPEGYPKTILSKDMDVRGNKADAVLLKSAFNLKLMEYKLKQSWRGRAWGLDWKASGEPTKFEVLETLPGVDKSPEEITGHQIQIEYEGIKLSVIDPVSLMINKMDVYSREKDGKNRNDLFHLNAIAAIMNPYFEHVENSKLKDQIDVRAEKKRLRFHVKKYDAVLPEEIKKLTSLISI